MRVLIFTATYNEADGITEFLSKVTAAVPDADILVVDDNSPDGTAELVLQLSTESNITVIQRPFKLGVGSAHQLAYQYAIQNQYDALVTMDADFSHAPEEIPALLSELSDNDFVIGSRFIEGGSCSYTGIRSWISKTANLCIQRFLGVPLHEATTSFRAFRIELLKEISTHTLKSDGYSFFFEIVFRICQSTTRVKEVPIQFVDRRYGHTKISSKEILQAIVRLSLLSLKLRRPRPQKPTLPLNSDCPLCNTRYWKLLYHARTPESASDAYRCTTVSHDSHGQIIKCLGCGLVAQNPREDLDELNDLYDKVEDETYAEHESGRAKTFERNWKTIRPNIAVTGKLLDIGCYTGLWLSIAESHGFEVEGVEPSAWAAKKAHERYGYPIYHGAFEKVVPKGNLYKTITSWDVLEHVANPQDFLNHVSEHLRPGGVLAFSTLDYGNWYARLLGEKWPWLIDMHLYYFEQRHIELFLQNSGLQLIQTARYRHIIDGQYLMGKLSALGVPLVDKVADTAIGEIAKSIYIPFAFGDIKLFVATKK